MTAAGLTNFTMCARIPGKCISFSRVHCSSTPLIFYVEHSKTCVWLAQKKDALLQTTLMQLPVFLRLPGLQQSFMEL